jgi:pimeloyl-ACP methyl ester carboxylesterase
VKRSLSPILAAIFVGAFLLLAVIGPRMLISGMRVPAMRTASEAGLVRYEDVAFMPPDRKLALRGWWLPADDPRGAVIVVHGGAANRTAVWSKFAELGADLQQRRFDVLLFDMRNHGDSDDSDDTPPTFGPAEANDVIGAVNFIQRRAPHTPVGVIGFSMGGNAAVYAAAKDKRIRAVVTNETYAEAAPIMPAAVSASSGLPPAIAKAVLWFAEHLHGMPISKARAVDAAASLEPGQLFVIHNEADPIVPVGHAWMLSNAAPDALLWITAAPDGSENVDVRPPWGTHAKSYALYPREYVDRVAAFLELRFD